MSALRGVPLSVLDTAPVSEGMTVGEALRNSVELARITERLGYRRFWVAEHHSSPGIASSSPAVLIAHVAQATSAIRVGSGGVMLPNHSSLAIAEQFGMLEALHPGRIDLGIGRAPGTDQLTAYALRGSQDKLGADDFPEQLGELLAFFNGEFPDDHPYRRITAVPGLGQMPKIWILGSSLFGAKLAGMMGLPFGFAHHFSAEFTLPALEAYRTSFRRSATLGEPYALVAASVVAAETDEEAERLALPGRVAFVRMRTGRPALMPSPTDAARHVFTDIERRLLADPGRGGQITGGRESVRRQLEALLAETGPQELMVTARMFSFADRVRTYEIVAELAA